MTNQDKEQNKENYNPEHTLELLWASYNNSSKTNKYGPKASLNVKKIVDEAINIADNEGIKALTVRNIANRLSIAPMSVYTYILNKNELIILMIDSIYLLNELENNEFDNWISGVKQISDNNINMFLNHPWLLEVYSERPTLGPGSLIKYEKELSVFENLGLNDIEIDSCLNFLLNFVRTSALDIINNKKLIKESNLNNNDWWQTNEQSFLKFYPQNQFPLSERVGSSVGEFYQGPYNANFAYEFGLNMIIESFKNIISTKNK